MQSNKLFDEQCIELHTNFFIIYIYRILPDLKEWICCNGIMEANVSTWNKLMDMYFNRQNKNILEYLTCSENSDILINFMNTSASNNDTIQYNDFIIKDNDYYEMIRNIIQKHSDNVAVLDYILENLEKITPR